MSRIDVPGKRTAYYASEDDPRPVAYRNSLHDDVELTDYGKDLGYSAEGQILFGPSDQHGEIWAGDTPKP